ncbi:MAG: hypothetical protein HKP42_04710 [Maribacter sp.]|nr:hypothetical protein [Maribacter sp.]NNK75347.1 hypothetical protein [Maribacter sp.]
MLQNKFWQAFFALAPIITLFLAISFYLGALIYFFSHMHELENHADVSAAAILGNISVFIIFIFIVFLIAMGSLVFYIVHAVQNPNLKENNLLIVWILLFVFIGGISQLLYWIIEILNKRNNTV